MRTAALLAVAAAALFVVAGPATAAKSCEQQVIDDWYDNGRVDKQVYEAKCYRDAIRSLPTDVLDYSSAKNDILRALSFAQRGERDPGRTATTSTPTDTTPTTPAPTTPEPTTSTPEPPPTTTDTPDVTVAAPAGESASSLPIPLIVLGGLALLLLSAGVAGYLTRRFRGGGEPPVTP